MANETLLLLLVPGSGLAILIWLSFRWTAKMETRKREDFKPYVVLEEARLVMRGEGVVLCQTRRRGEEKFQDLASGMEAVKAYMGLIEAKGTTFGATGFHWKARGVLGRVHSY